MNQYKKPNVKLIDLEVAKLLMGDPKFAFDKIPTGSSKTDKIMRRIMTEILDQFDPLNDVSRMFDMDPLSDEFKTTQLLLKKLKIDLNRDNSNLTPEYLRALMQCIPAKHRIIVDHIQMLLNSSVQIQTVDSETLSVDTVKLMNYDGLDKMLLAPQYHLGLDPKQVDQFHSLFFEALNMNSSALVKLGQKGFSMQDLFPMQDLILSKTGNYYYDTRSPKRPVANSKTFGREVYSVRIRKSKVDALWEKYQEIEKSVDTQIQFLKKQTSASYKGDQNELSLAMDLMRKSLVKKAFLSFSMVYLMENTRQDSNFKRFAKSFHAAKLNVEKSHVQSLLTAYADVYQGLDAQNMDMLTDLVLSELPFLLVGAGLTTIGAKLLVGGIKLAAKGLSAANKLSKVNRATTTVASSRAVLGTKAFIETVSKSKTGAHLLGVNNFVGASLMDSGKLLLTLGMADTVKQSLRRARETGKFSFNDFELIVQEVLDNMLDNSSESDIFAMSLLLPMAIRFSSVIVKPLLSRKLLSKFEVKLLQMQNVAVAKFAWNTRQLLAATSQETVVLASGAVISQAAFNGAAELLNTYFEAGYSKRDVYSLLLNVTKRYKYCNFATEVDLKNLSTLVAVLKMVSAK